MPTSMRHVAFFKHLNLQKSSFFVCVPILAAAAGSTTHWFSMQRGVSLCRSKPRFIRAYPQRCTVTHRPAGALQGVAMGDDVARARVRLLRHDVRRPKNRKLACLLQPSSLPSPTSFLPSSPHRGNLKVPSKRNSFDFSANRTEADGRYDAVKPSGLDVTHLDKSLGDMISLSPQRLVP